MDKINHFNSLYLNYLSPLSKWRVMNLESLRSETAASKNYQSFARVIRRMEKERIIESYKHRFNGKKYIYLSSYGERLVAKDKNSTAISKDSILHDLIVSSFSQELRKIPSVNKVELEHEIYNKREFLRHSNIVPDGVFSIKHDKKTLNVAFELELTQKSKPRIKEKAKQYVINNCYDCIWYLFAHEQMMHTYANTIRDAVKVDNFNKFMFILDKELLNKDVDLKSMHGTCCDKKINIYDFLTENGVKTQSSEIRIRSPIS